VNGNTAGAKKLPCSEMERGEGGDRAKKGKNPKAKPVARLRGE